MFEDLIPNKPKIWGQKPLNKDSLIKAMRDNIDAKEDLITDLLDEINNKNILIDDLKKEIDYLRNL